MKLNTVFAAATLIGLGIAGSVQAQTTTAPATNPPERLQGTTTQQNPATATTPGATAPMGTSATAPTAMSPSASGATTSNNAVNTAPANNPGAPVPGANSFTESEARGRIEGKGYGQVAGLKLDSKGIWRGTASKDGKTVNVALDYQGNVVAD